ncbi:MAG: type II toxin-antitoxin system PemK/MazF family toxin [Nanoarchaeota archaeon]|nr:type II toxin-antitoxin system PemK/MazF family toxin [Nanoarchaeota archaeon]
MKIGRCKRGEIFIANLNPIRGSEQGGTRPVLVVQNNTGNEYSPTTIVAPITSRVYNKEFPTNVFLSKSDSKLDKDSTVLLNQIRTIDKNRLAKRISLLDELIMKKVNNALKISLDLT